MIMVALESTRTVRALRLSFIISILVWVRPAQGADPAPRFEDFSVAALAGTPVIPPGMIVAPPNQLRRPLYADIYESRGR